MLGVIHFTGTSDIEAPFPLRNTVFILRVSLTCLIIRITWVSCYKQIPRPCPWTFWFLSIGKFGKHRAFFFLGYAPGWEQTLTGPSTRRLSLVSLDGDSLLENISYHCMKKSGIGNPWLICERMVWSRLSLCKDTKLSHFSLLVEKVTLPSSNVGPLSYPSPFPLPWYPFPYVLDVLPGFLNTYSLSHAYSWIGVNKWRAVLIKCKEKKLTFLSRYMPGTVSWQDFSYSPDRDKWILKGLLARESTGKILLTTLPSPSRLWGVYCPKALLARGDLGPSLKVPRTGSVCGKELGPVDGHNPTILLSVPPYPDEHMPILIESPRWPMSSLDKSQDFSVLWKAKHEPFGWNS